MKLSINKELLPVKAHYFFFMSGEFIIVHRFNLNFYWTSPIERNLIINSCSVQCYWYSQNHSIKFWQLIRCILIRVFPYLHAYYYVCSFTCKKIIFFLALNSKFINLCCCVCASYRCIIKFYIVLFFKTTLYRLHTFPHVLLNFKCFFDN